MQYGNTNELSDSFTYTKSFRGNSTANLSPFIDKYYSYTKTSQFSYVYSKKLDQEYGINVIEVPCARI